MDNVDFLFRWVWREDGFSAAGDVDDLVPVAAAPRDRLSVSFQLTDYNPVSDASMPKL